VLSKIVIKVKIVLKTKKTMSLLDKNRFVVRAERFCMSSRCGLHFKY